MGEFVCIAHMCHFCRVIFSIKWEKADYYFDD